MDKLAYFYAVGIGYLGDSYADIDRVLLMGVLFVRACEAGLHASAFVLDLIIRACNVLVGWH